MGGMPRRFGALNWKLSRSLLSLLLLFVAPNPWPFGHDVSTFQDPLDALNAIEAAPRFEILVTRVQFAPGRPNGLALSNMARMKLPGIKVLFTVAPQNVEYTKGGGRIS
jgi:hypothetical protein